MEGNSIPTTMAMNQNGAQRGRASSRDTQMITTKGNWVEEMRGSLMVVATVIATLTFQIAINPPGGVWQQDSNNQQGCASGNTCKAGTSVLATSSHDKNQRLKYEMFILLCTVSFTASQTVILFLLTGFQLRNRLVMWLLILVMCLSVICLAGAYVISIWMVMKPLDKLINKITLYYALFWVGLVALLCLALLLRFLIWLLKAFFRFLCCC
ncbi:uncharacterized protein DS421_19g647290 [Arachis hypogaea]|uniref:PGG domain-containing protein n=2 Tax=Arachis hypogaea TaxID=3818 RepID=A0A444XGT3_ARAHY|nr:uncharacterized protein DS421_19g647290 [Arachis hypogaea]RYQ88922.1 hypothetical protein Ahy_B09g095826 isoform A [Arachis hypogaea]